MADKDENGRRTQPPLGAKELLRGLWQIFPIAEEWWYIPPDVSFYPELKEYLPTIHRCEDISEQALWALQEAASSELAMVAAPILTVWGEILRHAGIVAQYEGDWSGLQSSLEGYYFSQIAFFLEHLLERVLEMLLMVSFGADTLRKAVRNYHRLGDPFWRGPSGEARLRRIEHALDLFQSVVDQEALQQALRDLVPPSNDEHG